MTHFEKYIDDVAKATNETQIRETFVILAARAYSETSFATDLALGAEQLVHFKKNGLVRRGKIDSFVDNVIVEFKTSLAGDLHAVEDQLRGYIAGAWAEDGSFNRPYVGVATDGLRWRVYSARPISVEGQKEKDNVDLVFNDGFSPGGGADNARRLADFLNRLFFRHTLLRPSVENIVRDFGVNSPAFITIAKRLEESFRSIENEDRAKLYILNWQRDLQVAYGTADFASPDLFVRHTYLAILARLLVWTTFERRNASIADLKSIYDGTYFTSKRVGNFVEDDYFHWHSLDDASLVTEGWQALVAQLATYDLSEIRDDILKPLYEALVDPEMRHDLGEYYTPNWLANQVVEEVLEAWSDAVGTTPRVLDPSCGSGSFLRAAIHKIRDGLAQNAKQDHLSLVINSVKGIDVHPLAVIISKATYLLAINDLIAAGMPVFHIPVYMANSLSATERKEVPSLFGDVIQLSLGEGADRQAYDVPLEFVDRGEDYDFAISEVVKVARSISGNKRAAASAAESSVRARFGKRLDHYSNSDLLKDSLAAMCVYLVGLIRSNKDTIYGFLLRNRYRAVLLYRQFDIVVGNPPWLTFADIEASDYLTTLLALNSRLKVAPRGVGQQAHTEIATIFMLHVWQHFVAPADEDLAVTQLAFVMPRSVFTASHHELLRGGRYKARCDVSEIWDLDRIQPLFNVPCCVLQLRAGYPRPDVVKPGWVGRGSLRVREPEATWAAARIDWEEVEFERGFLGKRSAWRVKDSADSHEQPTGSAAAKSAKHRAQHYVGSFRQGAILYPQTLLIVRPVGDVTKTSGDVAVRTHEGAAVTAKLLKSFRLDRVVDASTLHTTFAAEHILPYAIRDGSWHVVLPTNHPSGGLDFRPLDPASLQAAGLINTAEWLTEVNSEWEGVRKKREKLPLWARLDHIRQLTAQTARERYVVLYTASGSRSFAATFDTEALPFPFAARDKTYWASTSVREEAYYLTAFLNSEFVAERISDFMTRGLMGPRDVHKRVLDVPFPAFDPSDEDHKELADLAELLEDEARGIIDSLPASVARARTRLRQKLSRATLKRVDELVAAISERAKAG